MPQRTPPFVFVVSTLVLLVVSPLALADECATRMAPRDVAALSEGDLQPSSLEWDLRDFYDENYDVDPAIDDVRELVVGERRYVLWSATDWELDGGILEIAPLDTEGQPHPEQGLYVGGSDIYGNRAEFERVSVADVVDGPEPEIVVTYWLGSESHDGHLDDEHDDESPGVEYQRVAVLDTSLRVLATVLADEDGTFDHDAPSCTADVALEDVDCDGRRELVSTRTCARRFCEDDAGNAVPCEVKTAREVVEIATATPAPQRPPLPTEPINDDEPHLVIAGSFSLEADGARDKAEALARELRDELGFSAQVHDSRQFEELACCFYTVVADRHADREDALLDVDELFRAGVDAYAKQGFWTRAPLPAPDLEGCNPFDAEPPVLQRRRGYRFRLMTCGREIAVEVFNGEGKRKRRTTFVEWPAEAPVRVSGSISLTDPDGREQALVVEVVDDTMTTRRVFVITGDKDDAALVYAATVAGDVKVRGGASLTLERDGVLRRVTVGPRGAMTIERGARDAELVLPIDLVDLGFTFEAEVVD